MAVCDGYSDRPETALVEILRPDGFLPALGDSLGRIFGSSFNVWFRVPSWTCWSPQRDAVTDPSFCADSHRVMPLLEAARQNPRQPIVSAQDDGSFLVAIPVQPFEGPLVVAVGQLSLTPQELAEHLAALFRREIEHDQQLDERRMQLADYAKQVSDDLEEIQFLLDLTEHLELCDLQRPVGEVAQAILPVLRELICAEAIVVIPVSRYRQGASNRDSGPVGDLSWFGPRVLSDEMVDELMTRFGASTGRQPVVKNRLTQKGEFADFPGLECLLLTAVGTGDYCRGWLLALNRVSSPTSLAKASYYPQHGLSAYEFGSVEAGMMTATAVMLATHERNLLFIQEKETLLIGSLRALINAIDAKDPYTCGHSDRVALIARRLGQEIGLEEYEQEQLYVAGLLHDIGKIGIPDHVLLKPASLTDQEYAQIKQHSERGHAILKHLTQLEHALPAVLHHHERWDGQGYPHGLSGDRIPLAARVVAVADAYDAMTSCRPYRSAMPDENAEKILDEGAGTQWDPEVVKGLLLIRREIRAICRDAEIHTRNILGLERTPQLPQGDDHPDVLLGAVKGIRAK